MVGQFEQALLALMIVVIMLGMGASLTLKDFTMALRRPYGLLIGLVSQYGFMPLVGFTLAVALPVSPEVKIGLLVMGCMPGGTTSNIFTYFSKGNLALSVLMTVNSTLFGVLLIPLLLVFYASGLNAPVPTGNIVVTLVILLVPVALGMVLRRWNANVGALMELGGGALGIFFILFLLISWVPRNWGFLMGTPWSVFAGAILLGLVAIVEVVGAGIVEVHGLLHQPQPEGAGVEREIPAGIAGDGRDVMDAGVAGHGGSPDERYGSDGRRGVGWKARKGWLARVQGGCPPPPHGEGETLTAARRASSARRLRWRGGTRG